MAQHQTIDAAWFQDRIAMLHSALETMTERQQHEIDRLTGLLESAHAEVIALREERHRLTEIAEQLRGQVRAQP